MMKTALKNPITTSIGLLLPLVYVAKYFRPDLVPFDLPPIEKEWPVILGLLGIGVVAKDGNK